MAFPVNLSRATAEDSAVLGCRHPFHDVFGHLFTRVFLNEMARAFDRKQRRGVFEK